MKTNKVMLLVSLIIASISYTFGGEAKIVKDELDLNIHLMHPGLDSEPADPNAAIYVDGTYHMHYIVAHPYEWKDGKKGNSFSFVHITSKDMLNWSWEPTTLQPSFTGHGMFSGTAFFTKEGKPAIIYHGQGSSRNQIVVASDRSLNKWEAPYAMTVKGDDVDHGVTEQRRRDPKEKKEDQLLLRLFERSGTTTGANTQRECR